MITHIMLCVALFANAGDADPIETQCTAIATGDPTKLAEDISAQVGPSAELVSWWENDGTITIQVEYTIQ